jgi:ATP-dependent Lhr-like helicase
VDEDFAVESMAGDIFLLGTTSWRIRRVEAGRLRVEDSHGAVPSIPFWRGEAPGRTLELSREVASLREEIHRRGTCPEECGLDRAGAEQAVAYVKAGCAALGAIPTDTCVVAERFFDEGGGMQLVIHAPFGARINRAWGLALRKRFCRSFNFELQAAATDNGILISLGEQHSFPLEIVFEFLRPATVEEVLTQAVLPAPMFTARWRWNASRALTIPRFQGGRKVPPPVQRMRSDDLMAAVFPDQAACPETLTGDVRIPHHPLVKETISNCLYEAMDLDGLRTVLAAIHDGAIQTRAIDTPEPSPFSHEILNSNPYAYLDDAPLEERRARMVQMRRTLPDDPQGSGALDASAIAQVAAEAWPPTRDAEELHEALCGWSLIPAGQVDGLADFEILAAARRATTLTTEGRDFWVPAERLDLVLRVYPHAAFAPPIVSPPGLRGTPESAEACAAEILRGWFECSGPLLASQLSRMLAMPRELVDHALAQLEVEGQILRGRFTPNSDEAEIEWCHRNLLARIHRLTIGRLRREIEPVTTAAFFAFLNRWQHRAPGTQLHGVDGTLQIIRQWQGAEFPAAAWESEMLPRHVASYQPEYLDDLCLAGEVTWGRLSPHPAFEREPEENRGRRVRPTRVAPLAIFLREDSSWLLAAPQNSPEASLSHPAREVLAAIESHGASFFTDLTRVTGRLPSEVEDALWELVAAGLVTADGFENLRALLDPKRRAGQGRERGRRPRHAPGRWALLRRNGEKPTGLAEIFARQLLLRWGVLFRDLAAREPIAPRWRDLLGALRRLEARGEIRGGRFVEAYLGEQFALPEALDLLRAIRRAGETATTCDVFPSFTGAMRAETPFTQSISATQTHPETVSQR